MAAFLWPQGLDALIVVGFSCGTTANLNGRINRVAPDGRVFVVLRELALGQYGCLDFVACEEGDREIAIS